MSGIVNNVAEMLKDVRDKNDEKIIVMCVLKNSPFWLTARLFYVDTGDCGDGYDYLFRLTLFNNNVIVFDTDVLFDDKEVFGAFEKFSAGLEVSYIFANSDV